VGNCAFTAGSLKVGGGGGAGAGAGAAGGAGACTYTILGLGGCRTLAIQKVDKWSTIRIPTVPSAM